MLKKINILLSLVVVFHLLLLINTQFTAWPEMLSYPYLRNNQYLLYKDMVHPYTPGLTMALSWIYSIFGYKIEVVKIVTWSMIVITDIFLYFILQKYSSRLISIFSLIIYTFLQVALEGNMLWHDIALLPALISGIYFILNFLDTKKKKYLILSGISLGFMFLIKQNSLLVILLASIYILLKTKKINNVIIFLFPLFASLAILTIRLMHENALMDFINWVFVYPILYWYSYPGYSEMHISRRDATMLVSIAIPTIFNLFCLNKISKVKYIYFFVTILVGVSVFAYPRFSLFHLQPILPLLIMLFAFTATKSTKYKKISIILMLMSAIYAAPLINNYWGVGVRFYEEYDKNLANKISNLNGNKEKIYLLGLPSSMYVYSKTLPPKRWADNFGWYFEIPGVQNEIINRWEKDKPTYIIWKQRNNGNWFEIGSYEPVQITNWIKNNYFWFGNIDKGMSIWKKI